MKFRQLGETNVIVPEVGFGTWAYTGGEAPLRRAVELGAAHIDTAESYNTESDVGKAIRGIRDRVFLATKVSPEHFRRDALLKAADASLKRLEVDYIDLYQLHWSNPGVPIEETMRAMESLLKAGKVRFIGVSNFSVTQLREAQAVMAVPIVSNQVEYSLITRNIETDVLPYCQANGITVIAYSPFGERFSNILQKDRKGVIQRVAAAVGKTSAQVVLNWCLSKESVVVIPKANSVAHVEEDCGASDWNMSKANLELLEKAFSLPKP